MNLSRMVGIGLGRSVAVRSLAAGWRMGSVLLGDVLGCRVEAFNSKRGHLYCRLETCPLKILTGSWDVTEREKSTLFRIFSLVLSKNEVWLKPIAGDANVPVGLGCSSSQGGSLEKALPFLGRPLGPV